MKKSKRIYNEQGKIKGVNEEEISLGHKFMNKFLPNVKNNSKQNLNDGYLYLKRLQTENEKGKIDDLEYINKVIETLTKLDLKGER